MQREIFQKLVSHLGEHCQNILVGSEIDYRRLIAKRTVEQVRVFSFLQVCPVLLSVFWFMDM